MSNILNSIAIILVWVVIFMYGTMITELRQQMDEGMTWLCQQDNFQNEVCKEYE